MKGILTQANIVMPFTASQLATDEVIHTLMIYKAVVKRKSVKKFLPFRRANFGVYFNTIHSN